jgi:DNA polymerase I-like protein with 3'-5' exonuclease and polymerase domains
VIKQIEEYIDTRALIKRLKEEHKQTGYIKNRFGRLLTVDRPQDNIFVSYYAQSTGVDVSLMGFGNIIDSLGSEGIRPIFVLHDALILDVHPDRLEDVAKVCKVKVPGYDQEFPLKIEEISR